LCDVWEAAKVKPIVMCANAVTLDSPPTYKYKMSTVRDTLRQFAAERGYDFIDQFAETRALIAAGDTSWLFDGTHPNDAGYNIMFQTVKQKIDAA